MLPHRASRFLAVFLQLGRPQPHLVGVMPKMGREARHGERVPLAVFTSTALDPDGLFTIRR